jgi:CHAD domain-containing protein
VVETFNPPVIGEPAPPLAGESADLIERRSRLETQMGKQMRNFIAVFAKVISGENADAVHDLRVCTRRLQQLLSALVPDQTLHKARTIRRTLRDVRRALGPWRNCDVALQWVSRAERRAVNPNRRRGWALVREFIAAERKRVINKARRRLLKSDGLSLHQRSQQLIALAQQRLGSVNPDWAVRASIAEASTQWRNVLARAIEDRSTENVHGFRIQLKRMRYRVELARDLGAADTKPLIGWFKSLQDRLGRWHDRTELNRFITRALANPGVLLNEPRAAVELLKEVEKDISVSSREVDALFRLATESEGCYQFEEWVKSYCGNVENVTAEEPIPAVQADHSAPAQVEPIAQDQVGPASILAEPLPEATESIRVEEPPPAPETAEHQITTSQSEGEAKD